MDVVEAIQKRHSIRAFKKDPVPEHILREILNVSLRAPSWTNIQPWVDLAKAPQATIDQQEQADSLDTMLSVCSKFPWFKGFYWWSYWPQVNSSPLGYIIRGKKAEAVLSDWLKNYK